MDISSRTRKMRSRYQQFAPARGTNVAGVRRNHQQAQQSLEAHGILTSDFTPETTVALFGILSGVGGAIAQLVAGSRLQGVNSDIPGSNLAIPVVVSIVGTVAGAFLLPSN